MERQIICFYKIKVFEHKLLVVAEKKKKHETRFGNLRRKKVKLGL